MTLVDSSLKPAAGRRPDRLPARGRRQRDGLLAVLIVLAGMVLAGVWAASGDPARRVLAVHRPVAAGQRLGPADLTVRSVAGSGLGLVAAADSARVVGQTAAVDLTPGTLLTAAMLTDRTTPGSGEALVGVPLRPGAFPAELAAGMRVQAVATVSDRPDGVSGPIAEGRVLSVSVDDATATTVVSLVVPADRASALAEAAGAGQLSLVVLPPAGGSP